MNGFNGPVTLSCSLPAGLPVGAKCQGLPVTVKLMGGAVSKHSLKAGACLTFVQNNAFFTYAAMPQSVLRDWKLAKAWLMRELKK